jgi:predicted GNAT family N-acyltransferase
MGEIIVLAASWNDDCDELIQLRTRVFVEEQKVPSSLEIDGRDADCAHVKAIIDDVMIGTGRLLPNGFIGRMCVLREYRNRGIGTMMLKNLVQQAADSGHQKVSLNSQSYVIPFYQNFGFTTDSEEFIEAGILHRRMILNIASEI